MKHLKNEDDSLLQQVVARLEEWAEWMSRLEDAGLGYPSSSLEYQLLRGGRASRSGIAPISPSHEAAEEMEAWVCEMAQQNAWMAKALRQYYFHSGSLRQHGKELAISHMQFTLYLNMAHQWLIGRWIGAGLPRCKR